MSSNLSGNNIDNGDFMIKTCAADPEAGYAKEKFHADPKNGVIISEVDGVKGKRLEFSADWSVVSLETKLQKGDNIEISEDQVSGKVEISAPDVGKVLVDSNDITFKYLDEAITSSDNSIQHEASGNLENLTVPNLGKVKYNGSYKDLVEGSGINLVENGNTLGVTAWDKLNFAQFNAKWNVGDYDKSDISSYYGETAMLGKIYCDNTELYGVCFVVIQGNPLTLNINYTSTADIDCVLYYRIIGGVNWEYQSVTLNNSSGESSETSLNVPNIGDSPMEFLLVCEEDMGKDIARIFEIYAD